MDTINRPVKESDIQSKIIKLLEDLGWIVFRSLAMTKIGFPDVMAIKRGRCVFIEVKRPGERASTAQAFRHEQIKLQGFEVFIHTSVNETKIDLGDW